MKYEEIVATWKTPQDIDWTSVRTALVDYLGKVIITFGEQNPESTVYGLVIVHGQNWELSVYLNTEEGYVTMPDRFRAMSHNYPEETDEQILENLGRWYHDAWEFDLYEFKCAPEVNAVNNVHYELFDRLGDDDNVDFESLSDNFLQVCAESISIFERTTELSNLSKTENFELRVFDGNCHGWETFDIMEAAREKTKIISANKS